MQFCECLNFTLLPATERQLVLSVAELEQCNSSVGSYLSAIRHMQRTAGFGDPLTKITTGDERIATKSGDVQLLITPYILKAIKTTLNKDTYNHDNTLMWGACCLAFFAFL